MTKQQKVTIINYIIKSKLQEYLTTKKDIVVTDAGVYFPGERHNNLIAWTIRMKAPFRALCLFGASISAGASFTYERLKMTNADDTATRVAIIGIIVENNEAVDKLNSILHDYAPAIIGRMGLPYRKKNISIISVAVDAPQNVISALSGKLGRLNGVAVKTAYSTI